MLPRSENLHFKMSPGGMDFYLMSETLVIPVIKAKICNFSCFVGSLRVKK